MNQNVSSNILCTQDRSARSAPNQSSIVCALIQQERTFYKHLFSTRCFPQFLFPKHEKDRHKVYNEVQPSILTNASKVQSL